MPPVEGMCSLPGLAHAALRAVLCTLAACTDAACLGALSAQTCGAADAEQLQLDTRAELAQDTLTWIMQLPEDALSGTLLSTQVYLRA